MLADLQPPAIIRHDLFLFVHPAARRLTVMGHGRALLVVDARNATVRDGQYGRWGNCPPGWYRADAPRLRNTRALGKWFLPLFDTGAGGPFATYRRVGIGIHGGGSALRDPFAPRQPLLPTHGCVRLTNADMTRLVSLVLQARKKGGRIWVRVEARNTR